MEIDTEFTLDMVYDHPRKCYYICETDNHVRTPIINCTKKEMLERHFETVTTQLLRHFTIVKSNPAPMPSITFKPRNDVFNYMIFDKIK